MVGSAEGYLHESTLDRPQSFNSPSPISLIDRVGNAQVLAPNATSDRRHRILSANIGKILGIPIRIHWTLWLVFLLVAWSIAAGYLPAVYPAFSAVIDWTIGVVSAVLLFVSVLLHELSHSYIAKKNGLPIARITLFFFGGVSEMSEEPKDARLEVRMAAAGPLTSFAIAGVLGALWYVSTIISAPLPVIAVLGYNAVINVALGGFNLVPAFPLDGGRVLRGSLWGRSKNLLKATREATRVSEVLSLLMIAAGLLLVVITGNIFNGLWTIFLGWFIRSGAETSLKQTEMTEALHGINVSDIMTRDLLTVSPEISVQKLVTDYFLIHPHGGYPVVRNDKLEGVVTMSSVRSIPAEKREMETVAQAMVPYERIVTISPNASAAEALQKIAEKNIGRLLVTDGDNKILGLITRGDLMKTIRTRQDLSL